MHHLNNIAITIIGPETKWILTKLTNNILPHRAAEDTDDQYSYTPPESFTSSLSDRDSLSTPHPTPPLSISPTPDDTLTCEGVGLISTPPLTPPHNESRPHSPTIALQTPQVIQWSFTSLLICPQLRHSTVMMLYQLIACPGMLFYCNDLYQLHSCFFKLKEFTYYYYVVWRVC